MNIAISEHLPILENLLRKQLSTMPTGRIHVEKATRNGNYSLLLSDRSDLPREGFLRAELILVPGGFDFLQRTEAVVLTGGMNREDAVSFSSIGEKRAMLCLQREIALEGTFIGPFEKSVPFDRNYTLYKNLAVGFALSLADILLREES